MTKKKVEGSAITEFLINEYTTYKQYCSSCLFDDKCSIFEGRPCKYFEKVVLGRSNYQYRITKYNYEKLFELYATMNLSYPVKIAQIHKCECGTSNDVLDIAKNAGLKKGN